MKAILPIIAIAAVSVMSFAQSSFTCGPDGNRPRHYMKVTVDKIDNINSDGVSRVSCTLAGVPHTSSRIDSVTAIISGRTVRAVDIDGVDFMRYFQWEDEGVVPVDVDLERTSTFSPGDSIMFHTVHGVYAAPLKKK